MGFLDGLFGPVDPAEQCVQNIATVLGQPVPATQKLALIAQALRQCQNPIHQTGVSDVVGCMQYCASHGHASDLNYCRGVCTSPELAGIQFTNQNLECIWLCIAYGGGIGQCASQCTQR